jgi:glycosyltransferase involved in cell wall biosynthesis
VQRQVLPYLREIQKGNIAVWLLTFEPKDPGRWPAEERAAVRASLAEWGIRWQSLRYHRHPTLPATLYDILAGSVLGAYLARRYDIRVIHCRAHVPAAMGLLIRCLSSARLLYDIRGLVPDEYVDAGVWPRDGLLFRLGKAAERKLLASADGFVVLTHRARAYLFPDADGGTSKGRPLEVIPCCVDHTAFPLPTPEAKARAKGDLGLTGRNVIVSTGGLGGWYLREETFDLLATARAMDPSTFALLLTPGEPRAIGQNLLRRGFGPPDFLITHIPPDRVPFYLQASDLGLCLVKPCFSKLASSPTKVAEYLACGLPVISTSGVGDLDSLLTERRLGSLIRTLDAQGYGRALRAATALLREPDVADRLRSASENLFDLSGVGGERYRRVYDGLAARLFPECNSQTSRR